MRICVITPRYSLAGVPLAQIRFAKALSRDGHDVDLIIGYVSPEFSLPSIEGINLIVWNKNRVRNLFWLLCIYLLKNRIDVIFSAEDHLNLIVIAAVMLTNSKTKISGSSRVTPFDTYSKIPFTKRWVLFHLMRFLMYRADALTCVSKDMVKQYQQVFRSSPHTDVYNIVVDQSTSLLMQEEVNHPWLQNKEFPVVLAAGRLATWKGFDTLIDAIKIVSEEHSIRAIILGDGPLYGSLLAKIKYLDLEDTVDLVGYVDNTLKYFARADVFVLSSTVEGMPNVLIEAMACGCTPVATDCPTGPSEILQSGKYGYLVPMNNPRELANGIVQALSRPISTILLSEAITEFEEKKVINRHFKILNLS